MLANSDRTFEYKEWNIRLRQPEGPGPYPVLLLLHGWTGDENVMWVFTTRLSKRYLLLAPRGLYPVPQGGYGWHPHLHGIWPGIEDFRPAVEGLISLIADFNNGEVDLQLSAPADFSQVNLMGFSQGAALAYSFGLIHPRLTGKIAGLSGFLPNDTESLVSTRPLEGKQIFVAHGERDELVPVSRARRAVELLEDAGANVTYCEDDVGHKLSASCYRGMETFFELD